MNGIVAKCAITLPLLLGISGLAAADNLNSCRDAILKGRYVFTASGFTRPPDSTPGTPWVPKAIVEVVHFNGDGTLTVPSAVVANPFGDLGNVLQPPVGTGTYAVNDDCSGIVQFLDPARIAFSIQVDALRGNTIWLLQINPLNNVFVGTATRVK
jgi:hypothetical protein